MLVIESIWIIVNRLGLDTLSRSRGYRATKTAPALNLAAALFRAVNTVLVLTSYHSGKWERTNISRSHGWRNLGWRFGYFGTSHEHMLAVGPLTLSDFSRDNILWVGSAPPGCRRGGKSVAVVTVAISP